MDRRLIFRHPLSKGEQIGDAATTWIGVIDASVPQGRQHSIWKSKNLAATKSQSGTMRRPVPQSDTGVLGEHPKAFGRTLVKELGKMTPYPRYKGCSGQPEPQRIGSSDCLSKTQDSANSQEDV
jgi:hypothetical protein